MNVILMEKVKGLGAMGDVVSVKGGYARNFLIPNGKAKMATAANVEVFEARRAELEAAAAQALADAQALHEKMQGLVVVIEAKAGDEGKLFGSVGTQDVVDALATQGFTVERRQVQMPDGAIRVVGTFELTLALHADVNATITVDVKAA
ncbi:MAG: 50S ribosomal protein L9 [Thiotrichales bacterium 32-46-8]|jgi:large subunit ribosomal protein L9|nr:50S ribosomal protein L9 [Gammaproteobacteria bacterium]OYX07485.1 MAG: 50S ribosomal protein L9 [Thiotrichales bacterium 32-46-8]OYY24160.1 MAG: 50S ribosomal protein L9 [Thiotrichales bacterium 35-46-9]OYZ08999.1 MAG: 50S ribosomal protein L9 [Thiotrichales bacterium 16-46-22]OZA17884.1 MAG: 50S ribosomal protein L9 [Thiotrichales bacterium 17-46-47]OZA73361.1 MAG: 50S ribosomal protein L9 [Thiotrichales bacterium 39-47-5]OZA98333.1 MAG: 50S ribosomal protein L9 [Thiotrichales bacterium 